MRSPIGLICDGKSTVKYLYNLLPNELADGISTLLKFNENGEIYPCYYENIVTSSETNQEYYVVRLMGPKFCPMIHLVNEDKDEWFSAVTLHLPKDFDLTTLYEFKE